MEYIIKKFTPASKKDKALQKMRAYFNSKMYKLKDGRQAEISMLLKGGIVLVDGAPIGAGEHELANGTKITVDFRAMITKVSPS